MRLLHKLSEFEVPTSDMIEIYQTFSRSLCEQSCQVWHSSLTGEDSDHLERIQKVALKIILSDSYISYEDALSQVNLEKLSERREDLCLRFAKSCKKNAKTSDMFPLNQNKVNTRKHETFDVYHSINARLYNSAIPFMQRLLNLHS